MEQIAVVKITSQSGVETRRNMTIPKDIWEQIVSGAIKESDVTWELRKVTPVTVKPVELIKPEIKEVELIAEKKAVASPVKESEEGEVVKKRKYKTRR